MHFNSIKIQFKLMSDQSGSIKLDQINLDSDLHLSLDQLRPHWTGLDQSTAPKVFKENQ